MLEGLRREDLFTVVCEQFMTDTAAHADVILPATTQLEHLDVVWSWGHHYLTLNEPAIAPVGEARPNSEIFRLLARRLGLTDPCFDESDEEMLAMALEGDPAGISLAGLRERGYAKIDRGQGTSPHAEGGFATPSGKLELRCERMAEAGLDPLPFYDPPCEVADERLAERFPLALLTPKTHLFLNSTFANGRRQHAAQPDPYVVIHPDDAAPRGIADGATVRVHNDRGSFTCRAIVSDDARAGVPGRADGLVESRLRRRPQPAGDDAAATDDAARCPDVQRQPRRDRRAGRHVLRGRATVLDAIPQAQRVGWGRPRRAARRGGDRHRLRDVSLRTPASASRRRPASAGRTRASRA